MSAGHVSKGALINRARPGVTVSESSPQAQWVRDLVQRELEQAAASLVVAAFAKDDAPMVLQMLGIS